MDPFDLELALDRLEAELAPELAAAARAHHQRALTEPAPRAPPWPAVILDGRAERLAGAAATTADPALAARARTLGRWALAARVEAHPAVRAAADQPRDLRGLAARHRALGQAAAALGHGRARELVTALYGPVPGTASPRPVAVDDAAPPAPAALPEAVAVWSRVAAAHGLATDDLDVSRGAASLTVTLGPGRPRCVIGPAADPLDHLLLTLHEVGHALYAAQQRELPLALAAAPARWFDEAVAAWAVRAVEDPAAGPPELVAAAAWRRRRREALTARLAAFEARALAGSAVARAWRGECGDLDPAGFAALFDQPGVMLSYLAADRAWLSPRPGDLVRWARAGSALDPSTALAGF